MTKTCFCTACTEPKPKDCRLIKSDIFKLIEYATKTQEELHNSLKGKL